MDNFSPKFEVLETFGSLIKSLRDAKGLPLRVVAREVGIDTSMLGKIEKNERNPSDELIGKFSKFFGVDEKQLHIAYKSDTVAYKLLEDDDAIEILKVAEEKIKYNSKPKN